MVYKLWNYFLCALATDDVPVLTLLNDGHIVVPKQSCVKAFYGSY